MKTTLGQTRLRYPAAVAALLAACALAPLSQPLFAQTQAVTGFDDGGWNADDVRTSAGVNIVNSTSHAAGSGATLDAAGVAAQIDWRNLNGSLGNLGGVFLTGTSTGNGKSTLSVANAVSGLADATTALGSGFSASYRWQNTDTVAAGISFKIGIQSTAWAVSQTAFSATRSGEATWDLLLVCDPSQPGNTPGNTTTNGAFVTSTVDYATSKFFLFGQAGNTHFSAPGSASAKTLAEWAADPIWGTLLFGAGAKVSNTQFGFGSGNAAASAVLDFASVSYLNSGARIDFVDAVRHTGPGTDFGDTATWGGVAPSSTQNLVVEQNATLDVSGAQTARSLGVLSGSTGIVLAEGSSLVLNSAENGTLSTASGASVGVSGPGTLQAAVIEAGGTVNLASTVALDGGATPHPIRDGTSPTAKSRYGLVVLQGGVVNLQSGADVTLKNDTGVNGFKTMIRVGEVSGASGPGVLNIAPGARLSAGSLHGVDSWGALHVGDWGGQGEVNQTGGDVSILGAIVIGNEGGTGVYNLSGGSIELLRPVGDNGALIVGRATNNRTGSGTLNISGGSLTLGDAGGNVSLVIGGISDNVAAYANASGTVNQTGGVVRFENASLKFGRGTGAYNLNGGTLEIGGAGAISATTGGTYAFNLGGGTLKVVGANLTSAINFNVADTNPAAGTGFANVSTTTIDTNGLDASLSGALTGAGYLIKTGLGTLTLSGANNLTGQAYVTGGAIRQTAGASAINYLAVGSGAGLTGAYQMAGGSLDIAQGLQVGDWGGTGSLDQTGGAITVGAAGGASFNVGNQGGTGTYNLSGGSFTIANGFANLGRSLQATAGDGVLNLSGTGLFEIGAQGDLILGDRDGTGAQGAGTVNQTGGTLRVASGGELWIGAHGAGTYNLNGGVIELGGASLKSNYGNGGGGYAFNLGGGTLKVVGSDLATSINADLASGTADTNVASKIDTNGFDATWSGALTGAQGGLIKTGAGDLALSGNVTRSIGYLNSDAGSISQSAGVTNATELVVGSNYATKNGAFTLSGGVINLTGATAASPVPSFRIGDWGGAGAFTQTGGTINAYGSVNLGNRGGSGAYTLSGGVLNIGEGVSGSASALILGRGRVADATNSTGVFNATGGTLHLFANAPLLVGGDTFSVSDNARSHGTFTQSGTSRVIVDSYISIGANGTGAYNLNGGTLELGGANGLRKGAGTVTFTFGGGTLKVIGSDFSTSLAAGLADNTTSTIDTNGLGATWSGNLTGTAAKLTKSGIGTLTLAGSATRNLATFAVEGGSVAQTNGSTTLAEFMVGTANGNTGDFTLNGGSLTLAGVAPGGSSATLRVGDFGGTGIFTQKAGSTVTVGGVGIDAALNIGNQGGTGTYHLEGGNLVLAGGLSTLGRSAGSNPASSGVLNVSGGTLEITNGSSLIIGNSTNRPAHGTGVVNQTGGTVRVTDGALFVAGFGNGSYNLNGGVLEVGGDSLRARYNNTLSTSTFTLGGGTLKVIGSALATDVAPVLAAGTTSTINTNGLDATLSSLSGATGHLDKTGAGRLSLGSANIGALTVRGGSLEFTGAASLQSLTVQDGATLAFGTQDLSVAGNVAFDNGSTLALSIGALDDLGTIGVGGSLTFGGTATLTVSFANGFAPSAPATFQLFTFTSFGGSFAQVNLPTVAGHVWNTTTLATDGTLRLETAPIPEPATAATLAGLALLGHAALRRRRRAA